MELTYDRDKRDQALTERGLDFEDALMVFAGPTVDVLDDRFDYGETRWLTYGKLNNRMVALVWTPRGQTRHIISMRKANDRERKTFERALDRCG